MLRPICLSALLLCGISGLALAQTPEPTPQVPFVSVATLKTGNRIKRDASAQTFGNMSTFDSQATTRSLGLEIRLRTFPAPTEPYDVQCFFLAKDENKQRYIFDVIRTPSSKASDIIYFASKEIFGGSKSVAHNPVENSKGNGNGSVLTMGEAGAPRGYTDVKTVTKLAGNKIEGWIVRIYNRGKLVRLETSLPELKKFATDQVQLLDKKLPTNLPGVQIPGDHPHSP